MSSQEASHFKTVAVANSDGRPLWDMHWHLWTDPQNPPSAAMIQSALEDVDKTDWPLWHIALLLVRATSAETVTYAWTPNSLAQEARALPIDVTKWVVIVNQNVHGSTDIPLEYSVWGPTNRVHAEATAESISQRAMAGEFEIMSVIAAPFFRIYYDFIDNLKEQG